MLRRKDDIEGKDIRFLVKEMQIFLRIKTVRQGGGRRLLLVIHKNQESYFPSFTDKKKDIFTLVIDGVERHSYRTPVGINVAYDKYTYNEFKRNKPNYLTEWFRANRITPNGYVYLKVIKDKEIYELCRDSTGEEDGDIEIVE